MGISYDPDYWMRMEDGMADTPFLGAMLGSQLPQEQVFWLCAMLGRSISKRDSWGVNFYLYGPDRTGKSTLINFMLGYFDPRKTGALGPCLHVRECTEVLFDIDVDFENIGTRNILIHTEIENVVRFGERLLKRMSMPLLLAGKDIPPPNLESGLLCFGFLRPRRENDGFPRGIVQERERARRYFEESYAALMQRCPTRRELLEAWNRINTPGF